MTWTCSECRNDFQPNEKKYKFNLCHICYFNPAIAKLYRTGEKQPLPDPELVVKPEDQATPSAAPVEGVTGDDGLMLATQREMDDDTFQLTIREAHRTRKLQRSLNFAKNYGQLDVTKISDELDRSVETNIPVRVMLIADEFFRSLDRKVMLDQMRALPRDEQLYLCGYLKLPFPLPVAPLATGSSRPYPASLETARRSI